MDGGTFRNVHSSDLIPFHNSDHMTEIERDREREGGVGPIGFPRATGSHGVPFPHPLFPLIDFQVRVAVAKRGCVSKIRKKIIKYKTQKDLLG